MSNHCLEASQRPRLASLVLCYSTCPAPHHPSPARAPPHHLLALLVQLQGGDVVGARCHLGAGKQPQAHTRLAAVAVRLPLAALCSDAPAAGQRVFGPWRFGLGQELDGQVSRDCWTQGRKASRRVQTRAANIVPMQCACVWKLTCRAGQAWHPRHPTQMSLRSPPQTCCLHAAQEGRETGAHVYTREVDSPGRQGSPGGGWCGPSVMSRHVCTPTPEARKPGSQAGFRPATPGAVAARRGASCVMSI